MKGSVLIVEDELLFADLLATIIEDFGLTVCGLAVTADEAVRLADLHRPSLVLMDVRLKGEKDGVDAALAIWKLLPVPIIYLTASAEPENLKRIESDHPAGLLFKPVQVYEIEQMIQRVLGP